MTELVGFTLTAVGTIRGRVSRPELCLEAVESDIRSRLQASPIMNRASFASISVVIHLGEDSHPATVWGINRTHAELEVGVGVRFADVRRKDPRLVCKIIKSAALAAVCAGLERMDLLDEDLRRSLRTT